MARLQIPNLEGKEVPMYEGCEEYIMTTDFEVFKVVKKVVRQTCYGEIMTYIAINKSKTSAYIQEEGDVFHFTVYTDTEGVKHAEWGRILHKFLEEKDTDFYQFNKQLRKWGIKEIEDDEL